MIVPGAVAVNRKPRTPISPSPSLTPLGQGMMNKNSASARMMFPKIASIRKIGRTRDFLRNQEVLSAQALQLEHGLPASPSDASQATTVPLSPTLPRIAPARLSPPGARHPSAVSCDAYGRTRRMNEHSQGILRQSRCSVVRAVSTRCDWLRWASVVSSPRYSRCLAFDCYWHRHLPPENRPDQGRRIAHQMAVADAR